MPTIVPRLPAQRLRGGGSSCMLSATFVRLSPASNGAASSRLSYLSFECFIVFSKASAFSRQSLVFSLAIAKAAACACSFVEEDLAVPWHCSN